MKLRFGAALCGASLLFAFLALPLVFIQERLESGSCHHAQSEQQAKARSRYGAQRLGPVAVRIARRKQLA